MNTVTLVQHTAYSARRGLFQKKKIGKNGRDACVNEHYEYTAYSIQQTASVENNVI